MCFVNTHNNNVIVMMNLSPKSVAHWHDEEPQYYNPPVLSRACSDLQTTVEAKPILGLCASVNSTTNTTSSRRPSLPFSSKHHGNQIRSKYLAALGISPSTNLDRDSSKSRIRFVPRSISRLPPLALSSSCSTGSSVVSDDDDDDSSTCSSASSASDQQVHAPLGSCLRKQPQNGKKAVTFSTVTPQDIHLIPSRASLSLRTRRQIWITAEEMRRNYLRNVLEFRSENWDYRLCVEESSFLRDNQGHLVHPVHFILQQQQQQQQQQYGGPQAFPVCAFQKQPLPAGAPADTQNLKQHFCRVMSAQKRW
jgi:hypothetical protein